MALSLSRLSWWLWGGKEKESTPKGSSVNTLPDCAPGQPESLEVRRGRRKRVSVEERRRVDKEYDMVLVRSDDVCLLGSESDESDWSIGWLEPHHPDFYDDEEEEKEEDNTFAVLVPCYRFDRRELGHDDPSNHFFRAIKTIANESSLEGKKHMMEQWLPSHENF
ncbi:hypothetical protein DM860_001163 [Cuscuta australis]|uniref:Uncharacterized protein n=1 Tax=Cuscuta australis TaxID=267555 RepID=A0A328DXK6_9ASTE|nr:hypothetical protein DM860_001163 [Cuscuta australis]